MSPGRPDSALEKLTSSDVILAFSLVTLATFVVLTVVATLAGYQVKGEWLEEHANSIPGAVLVVIGIAVFLELFKSERSDPVRQTMLKNWCVKIV